MSQQLETQETAVRQWFDANGPVDENYAKQSIRFDILQAIANLHNYPDLDLIPFRSRNTYDEKVLRGELVAAVPAENFKDCIPDGDFRFYNVIVGYAVIRYDGAYVAHLLLDPFDPPPKHGTYDIVNGADDADVL